MRLPKIYRALCLTPACLKMGAEYAKNLSPNHASLDPCTDFEELVCGGWRDNHTLRPEQGGTDTLGVMHEVVLDQLRKIVEGPYPGESSHSHFSPRNLEAPAMSLDEQNFNKLQRAYNACMDEPAIEALGVKPIVDILDGLQPAFDLMAEGDLSQVMAYAKRNRIDWALSLKIDVDLRNSTKKNIRLSFAQTTKAYFLDPDIMTEYRSALTHVLTQIHPTGADASRAAEWADLIVKFETKYSEITPDVSSSRQAGTAAVLAEVLDIDTLIPQLNIQKVIKAFVPAEYSLEQERVDIELTEFWVKFSELLFETDQQTLEWYFNWNTIESWRDDVIADDVFKPYDMFLNKLNGREPDSKTPRYEKCLVHALDSLGWILSRFYVETSFGAKHKELGNTIIAEIRNLYSSSFAKHDWMEQSVKDKAVEKLENMGQMIGYPETSPNITDPAALHDYYADLNITDTYFSNIRAIYASKLNNSWTTLLKPIDLNVWVMLASTVNAYHARTRNQIVFPAGIMQPPLFSAELPSYINYGGFGSIAGHEVSHAFDDQGRKVDANGHLNNWWTPSTLKEYKKKTQCFVDQYSSYSVVGPKGETINIVGDLTLDENIADAGGLSVAYEAWKAKYLVNSKQGTVDDPDNLLLPGLENTLFDTPEKMFFLAFGNVWCSKVSPAVLKHQVLNGVHAPDSYRIKGTLENSRQFLEAFNCPVQEPRCELW
ncbi:endothelin-converting enzyme [Naviculisporaceae sp. PSN 640]